MKLISIPYGLASYALGVASLVFFILFANNHMGVLGIDSFVSLNIDQLNAAPHTYPLLINVGLIAFFGIQHSVMARPAFKKALTKLLPNSMERSTYVLATGIVTFLIIQYWQPIAGSLWHIENETARAGITVIYYLGWVITLLATFMINHFHLFGLQQSMGSGDAESTDKKFITPFFYKLVRHPIQTGVVIAMIATPDMTYGRLVLAAGMLIYIYIGLYYEERDLVTEFGDTYRDYMKKVPRLFPRISRKTD